jgi:LAS superfamily LD-carboxypeptidase LdcB
LSSGHLLEFEVAGEAWRFAPAAGEAFLEMRRRAATAGIDLRPVSVFRDYRRQLSIWQRKWAGELAVRDAAGCAVDPLCFAPEPRARAILRWSALPGASRHHWGTDCDLYDAAATPAGYEPQLLSEEYMPGGVYARLGEWLALEAGSCGFRRPYEVDRGGVAPEPWHLSHASSRVAEAAFRPDHLLEAWRQLPPAGSDLLAGLLPELWARFVASAFEKSIL